MSMLKFWLVTITIIIMITMAMTVPTIVRTVHRGETVEFIVDHNLSGSTSSTSCGCRTVYAAKRRPSRGNQEGIWVLVGRIVHLLACKMLGI